ncbi:MAG: NAD(P)/FAD-dependent oxidoreductase [Geminicoccaceae bacterium]
MTGLPVSTKFLVVGAGMHGLSTAWHLAKELKARGTGSGADILVIDKTGAGAGATGIACGCVRNLYMTRELHPILRHSVDVWMSDPITLGFQQVGYISAGEANQLSDYEVMVESQNACGYTSVLRTGQEGRDFLKRLWPDFKTDGIEVVLEEKPSGYAGTRQAVLGLVQKCEHEGVTIRAGVEVIGYDMAGGRVQKVLTNQGDIAADAVILCAGAWVKRHWQWLGEPATLNKRYPDGQVDENADMWTFWRLREGEVYVDQPYRTADDRDPPVLHVELMETPVLDPATGKTLEDYTYVYWKNGAERMDAPGVQGGGVPIKLGAEAEVDPYGHESPHYQAEAVFADVLTASMGQLMGRFKGCRPKFRDRPNGGIGAFTPDNVPIFDWVKDNLYMIADSNHGFKMIGVGKLVAKHLASGDRIAELSPFAMTRFAQGRSFGAKNTHSPWV